MVKILEVLNQISLSFCLRPVIRIVFKIAEPGFTFLPVNVLDGLHGIFRFACWQDVPAKFSMTRPQRLDLRRLDARPELRETGAVIRWQGHDVRHGQPCGADSRWRSASSRVVVPPEPELRKAEMGSPRSGDGTMRGIGSRKRVERKPAMRSTHNLTMPPSQRLAGWWSIRIPAAAVGSSLVIESRGWP